MQAAMKAVRTEGKAVNAVARDLGVPASTLGFRLAKPEGYVPVRGRPPILSPALEAMVLEMVDKETSIDRTPTAKTVKNYAKAALVAKKGSVGKALFSDKWLRGLAKRSGNKYGARKGAATGRNRTLAMNRAGVQKWYSQYAALVGTFEAREIYNKDDKYFDVEVKPPTVSGGPAAADSARKTCPCLTPTPPGPPCRSSPSAARTRPCRACTCRSAARTTRTAPASRPRA